jgi:hypothetical protein
MAAGDVFVGETLAVCYYCSTLLQRCSRGNLKRIEIVTMKSLMAPFFWHSTKDFSVAVGGD